MFKWKKKYDTFRSKGGYSFFLSVWSYDKTVFFLPVGSFHHLTAVLNVLIVYCLLSCHCTNFLTVALFSSEPNSDSGSVHLTGKAELSSSFPRSVMGLTVISALSWGDSSLNFTGVDYYRHGHLEDTWVANLHNSSFYYCLNSVI